MMKKIILLTLLLTSCICQPVYAFDLSASYGRSIYSLDGIKSGNSLKILLGHKGFYSSIEREDFNLYGQEMALNSLSVGYKQTFDHVWVYGQFGYYKPDYDPNTFAWEAIYIEQCKTYGYDLGSGVYTMPMSDHYRLTLADSFGAEVGVGAKYPIWKGLSADLSIGYRYLQIKADYDGLDKMGNPYWIMTRTDDFSAMKIYGGLSWEF